MTPHGPDTATFEKASTVELKPTKLPEDTLAFMFESTYLFGVSDFAQKNCIDDDYWKCWQGLKSNFRDTP